MAEDFLRLFSWPPYLGFMTDPSPIYDVAVIGLGAVGSAALYHLSKSDKKIIGIDRYDPPHSFGSSHGESRITRLAVGEGEDYVSLAKRSHEIWKEIEAETGIKIFTNTAGILIDSGAQPWSKHGSEGFWDRTVTFAKRQDISHELLDSDTLRAKYPAFQLEPSAKIYLEHAAGWLKPELAIQTQLDLAQKNGALVMRNCPVQGISSKDVGTLIQTSNGQILAKKVLLSAGGWIKDFLPEEERPKFKICRQVLHWLEIEEGYSDWEKYPVWMWGYGSEPEDFIYGFPSLDGKTVKMATESFVDIIHPDNLIREVTKEEQESFWREKIKGKILGLKPNVVRSVVCFYTVTEDARFVIRPLAGMEKLLMVSACSGHGFKHSTALGERLASMLVSD